MASVSMQSAGGGGVTEKLTAPYGSWKSPITAATISGGQKRLGGVSVDGAGRLIWLESRPTESGRDVLVLEGDGETLDLTPKEFAVRTSAQEYGGGLFGVHGETVIFSNYDDQRLYKQSLISRRGPLLCFPDGVFDLSFQRYIAVMDDEKAVHIQLPQLQQLTLVMKLYRVGICNKRMSGVGFFDEIDVNLCVFSKPKILVSGNDFYVFPRIDPKGE
ncbi:hypothetical protein V2J09_007544 [Rumex salicifolius]